MNTSKHCAYVLLPFAILFVAEIAPADDLAARRALTAERVHQIEIQMIEVERLLGDLVTNVTTLKADLNRVGSESYSRHVAVTHQLNTEVVRLRAELNSLRTERKSESQQGDVNKFKLASVKQASATKPQQEATRHDARDLSGRYRSPKNETIDVRHHGDVLEVSEIGPGAPRHWVYKKANGEEFFTIQGRTPLVVDLDGRAFATTSCVLVPIAGGSLRATYFCKDYSQGGVMRLRDYHERLERLDD